SPGGRGVPSARQPGGTGTGSREPLEGAFLIISLFFDFFRAKSAPALILGNEIPVVTEFQAMNEPHDPNRTVDVPSAPADSLDAGLAAGFGRPVQTPRSSLDASQCPVLLKEAEGESAHIVKPKSDAMPTPEQTGDRYQLSGEI